ncbi:BnaC02g47160D [Brassica napus]|uniref:BnaC02g47160D protein n=2 Tax=Brassica TaxID=3705 RepID=A0A078IVW9_BRANA|nr:BnaC02g47160D [Brassica napus]VDD25364.1 unnamed protein product [Brassica oleracea]
MASSSSLSSRNWSYDVFKSFSGEDVRKNFHNHFLEDLERKWIIAFKDNEKERSELIATELVQAIRDSRVVVVVLSNTFTSSSWCLNELLEIVCVFHIPHVKGNCLSYKYRSNGEVFHMI